MFKPGASLRSGRDTMSMANSARFDYHAIICTKRAKIDAAILTPARQTAAGQRPGTTCKICPGANFACHLGNAMGLLL